MYLMFSAQKDRHKVEQNWVRQSPPRSRVAYVLGLLCQALGHFEIEGFPDRLRVGFLSSRGEATEAVSSDRLMVFRAVGAPSFVCVN